jgi:hypothetical protein
MSLSDCLSILSKSSSVSRPTIACPRRRSALGQSCTPDASGACHNRRGVRYGLLSIAPLNEAPAFSGPSGWHSGSCGTTPSRTRRGIYNQRRRSRFEWRGEPPGPPRRAGGCCRRQLNSCLRCALQRTARRRGRRSWRAGGYKGMVGKKEPALCQDPPRLPRLRCYPLQGGGQNLVD